MFDRIFHLLTSFEFNSLLAVFLYWLPLTICTICYSGRCVRGWKLDTQNCTEKYYNPQLTIGAVLGRSVAAILPVWNLLAAVFDCGYSIVRWIDGAFTFALVRPRYGPPSPESK